MHLGTWDIAHPMCVLPTSDKTHGSWLIHAPGMQRLMHVCVRGGRQGEPMQAPKSPAAMKGADRGGRDSARPVGIQAVRESDETL